MAYSETAEYKGRTITLTVDDDGTSPRKDDNLATMAFEHKRYTVGDDGGTDKLIDLVRHSPYYKDAWEDESSRHYKGEMPQALLAILPKCKDIVAMKVRGYDHGGLTFSVVDGYPFNDQFDSGMLGFAFIERAKMVEVFPELFDKRKSMTKKVIARAIEIITSEVEVYNMYVVGDVWGWTVDDDSCWGYYGMNSALEAAKEHIDADQSEAPSAQAQDHHAA
jgi:hypothetical protein